MQFQGTLYRALNPYWAYRPLSGDGAEKLGGRFNRIGRPALYLAGSIETALHEVNQAGTLMPTTLISVEADLDPILDATKAENLVAFNRAPADLAIGDWAMRMDRNGSAPTQDFAEEVIASGFCGIRVPSYAPGVGESAWNMVLWAWGPDLPHRVVLNDSENRLWHPPAPPL